jgi:hypothetical protein
MRRYDAPERGFLSIGSGKASPDDRGWALNDRFENRLMIEFKYLQTTLRYACRAVAATADAEMRAWRRKQDRYR